MPRRGSGAAGGAADEAGGRSASQQGQRQQAKQQGEQAEQALEPLGDQLQQEREEHAAGVAAGSGRRRSTGRWPRRAAWPSASWRCRTAPSRGGDAGSRARAEQGAVEEGRAATARADAKGGRQERAGFARDRRGARGGAAADAAGARGGLERHAEPARGGGARGRRGRRAQRRRVPAAPRAGRRVRARRRDRGWPRRMERMAQLAQQQGAARPAGRWPAADGRQRRRIQQQLRQLGAQQRALARGAGAAARRGPACPAPERWPTRPRIWRERLEARPPRSRRRSSGRSGCSAGCSTPGARCRAGRRTSRRSARAPTRHRRQRPAAAGASRHGCWATTTGSGCRRWEELQRLSPEERRLVVDYFRRLSEPGPADETSCGLAAPGPRRALALGASCCGAAGSGHATRRSSWSAGGTTPRPPTPTASVLAAKPGDAAALLGLERALMPLNRLRGDRARRAGGARGESGRARRVLRRRGPGLGGRGRARQRARRRRALGRDRARTTRRRTANGAPRRCRATRPRRRPERLPARPRAARPARRARAPSWPSSPCADGTSSGAPQRMAASASAACRATASGGRAR